MKASENFQNAVGLAMFKAVREAQEIQTYMADPSFLNDIAAIAADAMHSQHQNDASEVMS